MRVIFLPMLALSFSGGAAAQSSLPAAPGAHVVNISPAGQSGSEPSIAVNPLNPKQVVAAYQRETVAYSVDGGQTFQRADLTPPASWRPGGDVSVAFDNKGHAYLCSLHFDSLGTPSYWRHGAGRNGIFVRRSLDGGKTWEKDAATIKAFPKGNEPDLEWEDMPRIFTDTSARSRYAGNLYVGWIEWQLDKSIILFSRSTDEGKTWSPPLRISTHAGLPRDDNGALVGFLGAVGADGAIHAIWNDGLNITYAESHDGGRSFTRSRPVVDVGPPYFGGTGGVPGVSRTMGFPQLGVDARALYVCWSDFRNGDVDVFISSSANRGRTWSKPARVNNDPIHNGNDQFFQWMAVDPVTGDVYVQFYDRRDDPSNRKTRITLARSNDRGKTFTNYAWTDTPFEGREVFLGDYAWLAAFDHRVYGIWVEAVSSSETAATRADTVVRAGTADFSGIR